MEGGAGVEGSHRRLGGLFQTFEGRPRRSCGPVDPPPTRARVPRARGATPRRRRWRGRPDGRRRPPARGPLPSSGSLPRTESEVREARPLAAPRQARSGEEAGGGRRRRKNDRSNGEGPATGFTVEAELETAAGPLRVLDRRLRGGRRLRAVLVNLKSASRISPFYASFLGSSTKESRRRRAKKKRYLNKNSPQTIYFGIWNRCESGGRG